MPSATSLNTPYIVISGVVLLAIVAIFTVFQPMLGTIRTSQDRLQQVNNELTEKQEFLRSLDRKKSQLEAQQADEQRLNVVLPTNNSFNDIIRVISLASTDAGNTVLQVGDRSDSTQAEINAKRARGEEVGLPSEVTPLAAAVTVRGSYQQLRTFLNALENSPRLNNVLSINIKRSIDVPDQITADLVIQFYYQALK